MNKRLVVVLLLMLAGVIYASTGTRPPGGYSLYRVEIDSIVRSDFTIVRPSPIPFIPRPVFPLP